MSLQSLVKPHGLGGGVGVKSWLWERRHSHLQTVWRRHASKAHRWLPYFCKQGTQVITLFLQARHAGYHLIFASKAHRLSPYFCKQGTQVITLFLQARHAGYHLPWHYFEDVHIILRMYTLILRTHTFCKQGTQVITFTFTYLDIILRMYTLFWECTHWCWGCKHYFEDVHIILRMYTLMLRMHTFYKQGTQVITFTFTYLDIILKMYHLKLSRFVLICRLWTTSSPCSNFVMHDAIAKGRPDPRTHK